jgi:hypothetical protein
MMYLPHQTQLLSAISTDIMTTTFNRKRSPAQQLEETATAPGMNKRTCVAPQQKPLKAVRFAEELNQVIVSASIPSETWYSAKECEGFRLNMKRDVYYLAGLCKMGKCQQQHLTMDHWEYSALGLEKYCCSSENQKACKAMKQQRVRCVLDQQLLQRIQGRNDIETIRLMAHVLSQQAVLTASRRAARVAASTYPYYNLQQQLYC